jgi:hypothetical protein
MTGLAQRLDHMTAYAESMLRHIEAQGNAADQVRDSLDTARRELALERARIEAPARARESARQAQRELADLKREVRADQAARTGSLALANIAADSNGGVV